MLKGSTVIGKPVVSQQIGGPIEIIRDIVFDPGTNRLLGFVISRGGWTGSARVLPWDGVTSVDTDAIMIQSADQIVDAAHIPRIKLILERYSTIQGLPICTQDGRQIAVLNDLFFDETTGIVAGYEVAHQPSDKQGEGNIFVSPQPLQISHNGVQVPLVVANLIKDQFQTGGAQ